VRARQRSRASRRQELPQAEVKVSAREVRVDERPEVVVIFIPRTAKDVRFTNNPDINEVVEEEWAQRGGRHGTERDGAARRRGGVGRRSMRLSYEFLSVGVLLRGRDGGESVEGSMPTAYWIRSLHRPGNGDAQMHTPGPMP
jgi:hypothetical protein